MGVRFEWDPAKAAANLRTHRVSFSEAVTVLEDEFALTREDSDAVEQPRFVTLGLSNLRKSACPGLRVPRAGDRPSDFSLEGEQTPEDTL
ncbi:MAG: BrnT family toxin [Candidatus Binatia bacterium]